MLEVRGLEVRFGDLDALAGVDLDVADRSVVAVLGPSGCGKTTLMRVIAGLQRPDRGTVRWNGDDLAGVPPHARRFGLMFQDYALFPHKTVAANVGFGLRMAGLTPHEVEARAGAALAMVGLAGYGPRSVNLLSGGEAQRVALARALAPGPRLLMLDEPIGSLDRALRERLMIELRSLFVELGITALYVTHDQEEAFSVADRLVVIRAGRVVQTGSPQEVWSAPRTEFVARFLGFANIAVVEVRDGAASTPWGEVQVAAADGPTSIVLRPEAFRRRKDGPIRGVVESRSFRGDHVLIRLRTEGGAPLEVRLPGTAHEGEGLELQLEPGGAITLGDGGARD